MSEDDILRHVKKLLEPGASFEGSNTLDPKIEQRVKDAFRGTPGSRSINVSDAIREHEAYADDLLKILDGPK